MVKGFYAYLEEMANDKVFVLGKWISMSSKAINKLIGAPNHEEGEYSVLMDKGVDTTKLVKKLCHDDKEAIWAARMNNQNLSFNVEALQLS